MPDHYRHNELLPEDLAMGMSPLQQLINTPPIPQDPSFWQQNPNGLLGHLSKVIGEDPSVVPKRMAVAMPAGLMDVAGGLNDLAIYGSNRVTNALGLPPIPAKTGFSGDPVREAFGLKPGGADEALELADPFMFPAKIGQAAKFAILPLVGIVRGWKATSFDSLLRNRIIDPKKSGALEELKGQALAYRNAERSAMERNMDTDAWDYRQRAARIEENIAAIEEAGEVPFTFYAAKNKDDAVFFAEGYRSRPENLSVAEIGLSEKSDVYGAYGMVRPQVMAVDIEPKNLASPQDVVRVTGRYFEDTSHLTPKEVLMLKKEGYDAAQGPIRGGFNDEEIVSFDPNNITIVRSTGQPLDVKKGDDLFSAEYLNELNRVTRRGNPNENVIEITPKEFLNLAKSFWGDPEKGKMARIEHLLNTGQRMENGPMLQGSFVEVDGRTIFQVKGHEGRHRMTTLVNMGLGDVPIKVRMNAQGMLDLSKGKVTPELMISEDYAETGWRNSVHGMQDVLPEGTPFPGYLDHVPKFKDLPPDDPKVVSIPDGAFRAWSRPYEGQNEPGALDIFGFGTVKNFERVRNRRGLEQASAEVFTKTRDLNMADSEFLQRWGMPHNNAQGIRDIDMFREYLLERQRVPDEKVPRMVGEDDVRRQWAEFKAHRSRIDNIYNERSEALGRQATFEQELNRIDAKDVSKEFGIDINGNEYADSHVQTALSYIREAKDNDPRTWRRVGITKLRDRINELRARIARNPAGNGFLGDVSRIENEADQDELVHLEMAERWLTRALRDK